VKLEGAFSAATAAACRDVLWRDLKLTPDKPEDWKEPVMRLGMYADPPFREAASSPRLHAALDQLVGAGRWIRRRLWAAWWCGFRAEKPWERWLAYRRQFSAAGRSAVIRLLQVTREL